MLHFREVTEFLRWHQDREFRMIHLVRMLGGQPSSKQEFDRKRQAIKRVLDELVRLGYVSAEQPAAPRGSFKKYRWSSKSATRSNPKVLDKL